MTSSLAHSIVSYLSSDPVEYDFALLSTAVGLVYVYGIGVPVMLWTALRYAGIGESWAMVEAVTVWGYAMFVWIPVSVRFLFGSYSVSKEPSMTETPHLFLDPLYHSRPHFPLGFGRRRVRRLGLFPCRERLPGSGLCTHTILAFFSRSCC